METDAETGACARDGPAERPRAPDSPETERDGERRTGGAGRRPAQAKP
jgi:hypothetical protein